MAIFPIRTFGDPVLRRPCADVGMVDDAVRKLMHDMRDTMIEAPGVGLAAPQIGMLRRVIVWRNEKDEGALANARIVDRRGEVAGEEACLSVPGLTYPVVRAEWVRVDGLDDRGRRATVEAEDFTARILQHEIDHTEGILFIDRLPPDLRREARRRLRELMMGDGAPAAPSAAL
ncbi:MAG: peptide deformylase [Actinomycetota bacterium]